jgi:hypothetical protein
MGRFKISGMDFSIKKKEKEKKKMISRMDGLKQ